MTLSGLRNKKTGVYWKNDFQSFKAIEQALSILKPPMPEEDWELVAVTLEQINMLLPKAPIPKTLEERVTALEKEVFANVDK